MWKYTWYGAKWGNMKYEVVSPADRTFCHDRNMHTVRSGVTTSGYEVTTSVYLLSTRKVDRTEELHFLLYLILTDILKCKWLPVPPALESSGLNTRIVSRLVLTCSDTRKEEYGNELHQSTFLGYIIAFVAQAHSTQAWLFPSFQQCACRMALIREETIRWNEATHHRRLVNSYWIFKKCWRTIYYCYEYFPRKYAKPFHELSHLCS